MQGDTAYMGRVTLELESDTMKPTVLALLGITALALSDCGLAAAPCRVTSAGLKIIPLVGPVAAAPTDTCANVIDRTPTRS